MCHAVDRLTALPVTGLIVNDERINDETYWNRESIKVFVGLVETTPDNQLFYHRNWQFVLFYSCL